MGIYDRDYAREGGGRRGNLAPGWERVRLRGLSCNTWLIIINIVVFLLDGTIAARTGPMYFEVGTEVIQGINLADYDAVTTRDERFIIKSPSGYPAYPIIDRNTGNVLGWRRIRAMQPMEGIGHFSTGKGFLELEVWRLLTFQFLHANFTHLFLNLFGLWMFGGLVERQMGSRRAYLAFYLACGICGALLYLALNLLGYLLPPNLHIPGVLFDDIYTPLIGASAGVFGVLIAAAYFAGQSTILLFFILPMKLRTAAFLLIGVEVWSLMFGASNAGGNAAHLGGAIAGFFLVRRPHLLTDFFDLFGPRKGSSRARRAPRSQAPTRGSDPRVDAILDKVRDQGLHSLSESERDILRKATQAHRSED